MSRRNLVLMCIGLVVVSSSTFAITPGDDLWIAGAARTSTWVSDLYINNPGATTVLVQVSWLVRDQANPNPVSESYSVPPDSTLVLEDVILNEFDMTHGLGAFRITVTGGVVTATLTATAGTGSAGGTFASGFEGIPAPSATAAGETANVMGVVDSDDFYTNFFALAGSGGAVADLDLLALNGTLLDTASVTLGAYEPWWQTATDLWDQADGVSGTLQLRVASGSMVVLGSKIDRLSEDPTTLEPAFGGGAVSADGVYQFSAYDSLAFASGGNLVVDGGVVEAINGTYSNFDKVDNQGNSECTLIFQWGIALSPTSVEDFETGVEFTDSYPDGGDMTWTVTFTIEDNTGFSGTLDAVGSNFSGQDAGCNGAFPTQTLDGGKSN